MPDVHLVDARGDSGVDRAADAVEVLLAGWSPTAGEALAHDLRLRGLAARPVSAATLPALTAGGGAKVLALGPEVTPAAALEIVREWPAVLLVLAAGERVEMFQELIDRDRLFFVTRHPPSPAETVEILLAASKRAAPPSDDDADVEARARVLELLRRIAGETDLTSALRQIALEAQVVADAERAQV